SSRGRRALMSGSPPGGRCSRCGEALPAGAAFCPACGTRVAETAPKRTAAVERGLWRLRDRAGAVVSSVAVRSQAQKQLGRLRLDVEELRRRRSDLLARLGEAVYTGDTAGTEEARGELGALDAEIEAKEREMATVTETAVRQLEEARLRSAPTV